MDLVPERLDIGYYVMYVPTCPLANGGLFCPLGHPWIGLGKKEKVWMYIELLRYYSTMRAMRANVPKYVWIQLDGTIRPDGK